MTLDIQTLLWRNSGALSMHIAAIFQALELQIEALPFTTMLNRRIDHAHIGWTTL